ncbi:hypothetical protein [Streptomyces sp. NPDC001380]|uniref:hypothetical protein n=1 Tax=Streptomyces sp. NPDC001380 TaxID=3364566 RepID=UPI0036A3B523
MSLLTTLARLEAVHQDRAQPLATVRHRHLSDRPMVVVPLAAAGEDGAPLAAMLGTDRDAPRLHVVPQPLDRDQRFAFLAALAGDLLPYLEGYGEETEQVEGTEKDPETGERLPVVRELCADAPQLVVPNSAGVHHLGLLGRSTRFRRTADDADAGPYPVPSRVPLLGRWLTHLRERAEVPGSSMLLAMTALLGRHWATGQSHLEDQHLGALLAWIAPPPGLGGAEAARYAESARDGRGQLHCPPAGPATDPRFDEKLLGPAVARHDAARAALRAAPPGEAARAEAHVRRTADEVRGLLEQVLRPTWDQVWRGLDLLRALPPGARVAERWEGDRWSYTGHRERLAAGEPPQPRFDDAVTAARKLAQREREQARLDLQEALDDPLAMAEHRLSGEAFAGTVEAVEAAYDTSGRTPKPRPLVTVRTGDRPHADPGREVHRVWGPPGEDGAAPAAQKAEVVRHDPAEGTVVLRLTSGMGRRREPEPGTVPQPGDRVCFTLFELSVRQAAPLPDPQDTPWTHGGPPGSASAVPGPRPGGPHTGGPHTGGPAAAATADEEWE